MDFKNKIDTILLKTKSSSDKGKKKKKEKREGTFVGFF